MTVRAGLLPLSILSAALASGCAGPPDVMQAIAPLAGSSSAQPSLTTPLTQVDARSWFQQTQETFQNLDRNSDRRIDLAEIRAGFAVLDLDRDGYLTGHEALSLIETGDRDGDRRLSREELLALPQVKLSIDLDSNGSISPFELNLARTDDFGRVDQDGDRRLDPQELRTAERFSYFRF